MAGEGTLNLPALAVLAAMKAAFHLPPIGRLRPAVARIAGIESDHRRADAQPAASEAMIMFAVIAGIPQQAINGQVPDRLLQSGRKLGRVLTGARRDKRRGQQRGGGVTDHRQFGPAPPPKAAVALARDIVGRDMPALQPCGVNCSFGAGLNQASSLRSAKDGGQQVLKRPFFKSRRAAYARVE